MSGLLDLDTEMEMTLDGVEAAPEFINPPDGKYMLTVKSAKMAEKDGKDEETGQAIKKASVRIVYSVAETIEIADGEAAVPNGTMFSENFQWTPQGKQYLKARLEKILSPELVAGAKMGDIFKELPNVPPFAANLRTKITKGEKGSYENVNIIILPKESA